MECWVARVLEPWESPNEYCGSAQAVEVLQLWEEQNGKDLEVASCPRKLAVSNGMAL